MRESKTLRMKEGKNRKNERESKTERMRERAKTERMRETEN